MSTVALYVIGTGLISLSVGFIGGVFWTAYLTTGGDPK